jgi:HEAT repeat protein
MDGRPWMASVLLTLSGFVSVHLGAANRSGELPVSPEAVTKALKALELPHDKNAVIIINEEEGPTKRTLLRQYPSNCQAAIDLLTRTETAVNKDLLRLAGSNHPLHVRYRAVHILVARRNRAVVPLLDRMCSSEDANERYVAWETYWRALSERKLPAPKDVTQHLILYGKESDTEILECMERFFGNARAEAAAKPLLQTLQQHPGSTTAIWSLGMIGDRSAVPAIIQDFAHSENRHYHLQALGKLATPEAVDFLIVHLGEYDAVDALFESRSKKALPALQGYLEQLKKKGANGHGDLAAARIGIIRLSQEDCRETLLKLAEDRKESHDARCDALRALRDYDTSSYQRRILEIYKADPDSGIKCICIWFLRDSKLEGITEAMMDHVLQAGKIQDIGEWVTQDYLREALNERLGTFFQNMEQLRAHVLKLRKT